MEYKDSGVDLDLSNRFVDIIKPLIRSTFKPEVLIDIGGFAGFFSLDISKYTNPILVSSTDGVGTKLKIAFMMNKHDTIGIDLVAMCVNDIITCGAKPLFFLDYLSTSKLNLDKGKDILKGISKGCIEARCSLIGGETAEMPSFYKDGEYDLAGFVVGIVDRNKMIDGSKIKAGDKIIGIRSSGLHSNGYSLVRKIIFDKLGLRLDNKIDGIDKPLGEELLKPTRIYVDIVHNLIDRFKIKGIAHITGGGFIDNIPRVIPGEYQVIIYKDSWDLPPIFKFLKDKGNIPDEEMFRTFNNGIGMIIIASEGDVNSIVREFKNEAYLIGEIVYRKENRSPIKLI
jgi:phosphoribosylformylglycinamidine cyclo-ligase